MELYAWCIMTSHVHLIIGTCGDKMEDIIRDMKRHTSKTILAAIKEYPGESRKEWMLWMFERAGKHNSNNEHYHLSVVCPQLARDCNHPVGASASLQLVLIPIPICKNF
ncbi:MAG: transposase [Opitutaceae bacterium]|nr:transposase [Cytophagales bacterium]